MAGAAWVGRIDAITDAGNFEAAQINVSYFDAADNGFTAQLWQHTFTVEFGTSQKDIAATIIGLGQQQRAVAAQIAALQVKVGTTVPVP